MSDGGGGESERVKVRAKPTKAQVVEIDARHPPRRTGWRLDHERGGAGKTEQIAIDDDMNSTTSTTTVAATDNRMDNDEKPIKNA